MGYLAKEQQAVRISQGGAMADSTFWHNLGEEFINLDSGQVLRVVWQCTTGTPGSFSCRLEGGSEWMRLSLKRLIQKAVVALGESGKQEPFALWCDKLRKNDPNPRNSDDWMGPEVLNDGRHVYHQVGTISHPGEASAALCIALEMQSMEAQGRPKCGAVPSVPLSKETHEPKSPIADAEKRITPSGRTRPGPKPDRERARKVTAIVWEICEGKELRAHLDKTCEALDERGIPCPKTWKTREIPIRDWEHAAACEPGLAMKAIKYQLENAQN